MVKRIIAILLLACALAILIFIIKGGVIFPHIIGPVALIAIALVLLLHKGKKT